VPHRWLVFVHQLPAQPSNLRVKTWRRLQQLGAVALKNAVHVLPDSAHSREDFEWLRAEVAGSGGEASILTASLAEADERPVVARFQASSAAEFTQLRKEIRAMKVRTRSDQSSGASNGNGLQAVRALQERFARAAERDVFAAPGSREVEAALRELDAEYRPAARPRSADKSGSGPLDLALYRRRMWVTRPRPGVDRFSSAWLIRRFIDREARFVFAASPEKYPEAVPFDMYQSGGFKHEGELCTFEVLQERFGVREAAVTRIGEIVHDIDLKEDRYKSPHTATVARLVDGLRAATPDDARLLEQGICMFEALYLSFGAGKAHRTRRLRC
jgi:hypothetical protein